MLNWFLKRVRHTRHAGLALRIYLWWGLFLRGALLFALLTLLIAQGNFLAKWLLTLQLPFVPRADVEELTVISYASLFLALSVGSAARWELLRRLDETEPILTEDPSSESSSSPDQEPEPVQ
ncbi:MAG: hypothetical protein ABEL04_13920 [Salinibacter sp.]|uniref:hypothetical protein n=1 Tax=Salinibacter sp. TaxID=2065818 RepID=UPI0035D41797